MQQLLIIAQIDLAQDHGAEDFFSPHQMVQIGAREAPAIGIGRLLVERPRIVADAGRSSG